MRRGRWQAVLALVAYVAAALVLPIAHRRHHLAHGADHTHDALGTHYHEPASHEAHAAGASALGHAHAAGASALGHAHAAFEADLEALALTDAAEAGALSVDCALAEYTLAACEAHPGHAAHFGDALAAHDAPPADRGNLDPQHGAGSPEHLRVSVLPSHVFVLPPPVRTAQLLEPLPPVAPHRPSPPRPHAARGPPSLS